MTACTTPEIENHNPRQVGLNDLIGLYQGSLYRTKLIKELPAEAFQQGKSGGPSMRDRSHFVRVEIGAWTYDAQLEFPDSFLERIVIPIDSADDIGSPANWRSKWAQSANMLFSELGRAEEHSDVPLMIRWNGPSTTILFTGDMNQTRFQTRLIIEKRERSLRDLFAYD